MQVQGSVGSESMKEDTHADGDCDLRKEQRSTVAAEGWTMNGRSIT